MNIAGKTYERLTVLKLSHKKGHKTFWLCECECKKLTTVETYKITSGLTKSCGCYGKEIRINRLKKHGLTNSGIYNTWHSMLYRCENEKDPRYKDYGGRGIKVCDEWHDLNKFYEWAINNNYKRGLSIDRIDPNGNYEPNNCRWATRVIQMNNRRNNNYITVKGRTKTVKNWSRITGLPYTVISSRLSRGWNEVEAITFPVSKTRKYVHRDSP